MRLVVGLGNPGARYCETPHNAGFRVCDRLAERHRLGDEVRKFQGRFRRGRVGALDVGVLKPQTYMNASGDSVAEAVRYLPVEAEEVVVVFDDIDLPEGRLRIRPGGGDGGHRGVRSLIERLGTRSFARIRVGVGRGGPERDATSHVLGRMRGEARERFTRVIERAVDALETLLEQGVDEAMNRYNAPWPESDPDAGAKKEDPA